MELQFYKYQGTGNDFVMIDNRDLHFPKDRTDIVAFLCDRKFGVGADGLILLEHDPATDFKMVYYNADGNQSSMCGNGGRCLVAFAKHLGVIQDTTTFMAVDGLHHASITGDSVRLQMVDVEKLTQRADGSVFLDTGSPHHVTFVENIDQYDVFSNGKSIRNGAPYFTEGTNVNFVEKQTDTHFKVRTYERGVENETLSCGTGATAVAIAMHYVKQTKHTRVLISVPGGDLTIHFTPKASGAYTDVFLEGAATFVFKGNITCAL